MIRFLQSAFCQSHSEKIRSKFPHEAGAEAKSEANSKYDARRLLEDVMVHISQQGYS